MSLHAYLAPDQWTKNSLELPREEAHHITSVRRAVEGDVVVVMDGCGRVATTRLTTPNKKKTILEIEKTITRPRPSNPLVLAPAMMNATRWDWLLQKATELGVSALFPLITARTQERKKARLDRWKSVCIAAIKQSGNPWLPTLQEPQAMKSYLASCDEKAFLLYGDQNGDASEWKQRVTRLDSGVSIIGLTGPEGGFTSEEIELLRSHNALPLALSPHTLRAETAALSFLAGISMTIQPSSV